MENILLGLISRLGLSEFWNFTQVSFPVKILGIIYRKSLVKFEGVNSKERCYYRWRLVVIVIVINIWWRLNVIDIVFRPANACLHMHSHGRNTQHMTTPRFEPMSAAYKVDGIPMYHLAHIHLLVIPILCYRTQLLTLMWHNMLGYSIISVRVKSIRTFWHFKN